MNTILDEVLIGTRIRKIREELLHESRTIFAERCGISENHLGKLERGESLITINTLNRICSSTGTSTDYILYGINENTALKVRKTIDNFLDHSSPEELKMYLKFISTIKNFMTDN